MKIIKEGKLPELEEYGITCNYCNTVFSFQRNEVEFVPNLLDSDFLKVKCPLCTKYCITSLKKNFR